MLRDPFHLSFSDAPGRREGYNPVRDVTQQVLPAFCADGDEIPASGAVVPICKPSGSDSVRVLKQRHTEGVWMDSKRLAVRAITSELVEGLRRSKLRLYGNGEGKRCHTS